jgi:glucose-1-phosphatase
MNKKIVGNYMREWLADQGLVTSGECPAPESFHAYANSVQRTVATAQFFIDGAFPGCDVADQQWRMLSQLKNGCEDTLFAAPEVAGNVAAPLVQYIRQALVGEDAANGPKVKLMVGHDANITSLLTALQSKPYELPEQYERTPIGGKIMFERWHDKGNGRDLMKTEYVYQSAEQLRNGDVLTLKNLPKRVTLQLAGCPTDVNGFCSWDKFTEVLSQAAE